MATASWRAHPWAFTLCALLVALASALPPYSTVTRMYQADAGGTKFVAVQGRGLNLSLPLNGQSPYSHCRIGGISSFFNGQILVIDDGPQKGTAVLTARDLGFNVLWSMYYFLNEVFFVLNRALRLYQYRDPVIAISPKDGSIVTQIWTYERQPGSAYNVLLDGRTGQVRANLDSLGVQCLSYYQSGFSADGNYFYCENLYPADGSGIIHVLAYETSTWTLVWDQPTSEKFGLLGNAGPLTISDGPRTHFHSIWADFDTTEPNYNSWEATSGQSMVSGLGKAYYGNFGAATPRLSAEGDIVYFYVGNHILRAYDAQQGLFYWEYGFEDISQFTSASEIVVSSDPKRSVLLGVTRFVFQPPALVLYSFNGMNGSVNWAYDIALDAQGDNPGLVAVFPPRNSTSNHKAVWVPKTKSGAIHIIDLELGPWAPIKRLVGLLPPYPQPACIFLDASGVLYVHLTSSSGESVVTVPLGQFL